MNDDDGKRMVDELREEERQQALDEAGGMEEWARSVRATQRQLHKARNLIQGLTRAEAPKMREEFATKLRERLDRAEAELQPATIIQWLQEHPVHQPQVAPGLPPGNRCKKCELVKADAEFFYKDGHGHSGYTGRCASCRGH